MYKLSNKGWLKHFDFTLMDIVSLEIAFILSYVVKFGRTSLFSDSLYSSIALMLPVLHVFIVFFTEEYSGILRRGYLKELKEVLKHNSIILALLFFIMFATKQSEEYSRIVLFAMWGFSCVFVWLGRVILKKILFRLVFQEKNLSYLLVITVKDMAQQTIEKMQMKKFSNYQTSGLVIVDSEEELDAIKGVPIVANHLTLMEYIRTNPIDSVFVSLPNAPNQEIEELTERLVDMGITVHISLNYISDEIPNKVVEELNGYTVLTSSIKIATPRQMFIKRIIDICGGLAGLLATFVAALIFGPIIYKQSPGPIFFSQERVGRGGRRFHIYKFRSMYMDAEERKKELMEQNKMKGLMFKMDDDPRILPIGKFIRKWSIDELPQSINILRGDMSLVGTRPPTVDEYNQYEFHHKRRLAARPGLTGMWQVSGRSDITDFEEIVELDTEYIRNFSLKLYIKILFKTVGVVLGKKGSV
ncbi:sugar transferase [Jeotgalibaca ciconiae]|uniref:Sugar transferase n=2 Tax=Jeotgalibaca ciconiae TaxID=2496265 RepID=A0A3S9HC86_9LACT|nr:sugar transferase [Jeotgalibaca ciconiae]